MRFPEFDGEWEETTLGNCAVDSLDYGMNAAAIDYDGENRYIRITDIDENSSRYISCNPVSPAGELLDKYIVKANNILFARTGASTGKTYLYKNEDGKLYFAGFLIRAKIKTEYNSAFIFAQTQTSQYHKWVQFMSIRSGQPGINSQEYASYKFLVPKKDEQDKIAAFLSLLDQRIETQSQIIKELKSFKKILRNNLYQQIVSTGKSERIENLLHYEQPTNYIVTNTNYSNDNSLTPVLTANKAFVLGYTDEDFGMYNKGECVIFDDFTMDLKYVDFPFKVKSSAIKILTAKRGVNLRYISEYLSFLKLTPTDHKRHYISEIEPIYMPVPEIEVQNRIANTLFILDKKIDLEIDQYELLVKHKKYLMSQMFI